MKTQFAQGQKVYEARNGNIFLWDVVSIYIETNVDKKWTTTEIKYHAERKEKVGLLQSETKTGSFKEGDNTIFATKNEALAYIEKVKEAKKIVGDNSPYVHSYFWALSWTDCYVTAAAWWGF